MYDKKQYESCFLTIGLVAVKIGFLILYLHIIKKNLNS